MRGLFGGNLTSAGGRASEAAPPALIEALAAGAEAGAPTVSAGAASLVVYDVDLVSHRISYSADLEGTTAIDEATAQPRAVLLAALAAIAESLAELHAAFGPHGDLRPATVRLRGAAPILVVPSRRAAPGASLAARLAAGAAFAIDVAFAAPEVATSFESTEATDVYALAAIVHRTLTGMAPLGQIDFVSAQQGPLHGLVRHVASGLSASAAMRPTMASFAAVLRASAIVAERMDVEGAPVGGPYRQGAVPRSAAASPAQAAAIHEGASQMSAILVLVLVLGGFFVVVGALWLVAINWDALGETGRFALLALATAGVAVAGFVAERRDNPRSGFALLVVASQILWADAWYLLYLVDAVGRPGPWTVAAAAVTAVTFALAVYRQSSLASSLAAIGFGVAAGCLGAYLHTGADTGPSTYALAVAIGFVTAAALGQALGEASVGAPFAVGAVACGWLSAGGGLTLLADADHLVFGTAWPYLVLAVALLLSQLGKPVYRALAWTAVAGLFGVVPTAEALIRHDVFAYLFAAEALGIAVVVGAFLVPWVARDSGRQHAALVLGLSSAVAAPTLLFLAKCGARDVMEIIGSANVTILASVCIVPAILVAASYVLSARAPRKSAYRLVELAALAQFFGLFTLTSLVRYDDYFYPGIVFVVGTAVLAAGVLTRRVTLASLAACALIVNLWIQYFAKLRGALPMSLLVLGFGVGLLGFGVIYERRVKHLLPRLRGWA